MSDCDVHMDGIKESIKCMLRININGLVKPLESQTTFSDLLQNLLGSGHLSIINIYIIILIPQCFMALTLILDMIS